MDSSDLRLQHGVDQPMAREHVLALELGGDNDGLEGLSATTCSNQKINFSFSKKKQGMMSPIPDKSSISTCCACSCSINLLFRESGVIPDVSAMAALMAAEERAATEKDDARGRDGCGVRR
jgi:hypothetical protein